MAKKIVPIPLEEELRSQLYEAMQGDAVLRVMKTIGIDKNSVSDVMERLNYNGAMLIDERTIQNLPEIYTELYNVFLDSKRAVGCSRKRIELIVDYTTNVNACVCITQTPGEPHLVVINSIMLNAFSMDELRFVIGHELGHIICDSMTLSNIHWFLYRDEEMVGLDANKYYLRSRLEELIADRYGYLACPDIEICCNALQKLETGLNIDELGMTFDVYLKQMVYNLGSYLDAEDLDQTTHPFVPVRVNSLISVDILETQGEDEYNASMDLVYRILYKLHDSLEAYLLTRFVVLAGYKVAEADGEVTKEEKTVLFDAISEFTMLPEETFEEIMKIEDKNAELGKVIRRINLKVPEQGPNMLKYLISMAVSDGKLSVEEIKVLTEIAKKLKEVTPEIIAEVFREVFVEEMHTERNLYNI